MEVNHQLRARMVGRQRHPVIHSYIPTYLRHVATSSVRKNSVVTRRRALINVVCVAKVISAHTLMTLI